MKMPDLQPSLQLSCWCYLSTTPPHQLLHMSAHSHGLPAAVEQCLLRLQLAKTWPGLQAAAEIAVALVSKVPATAYAPDLPPRLAAAVDGLHVAVIGLLMGVPAAAAAARCSHPGYPLTALCLMSPECCAVKRRHWVLSQAACILGAGPAVAAEVSKALCLGLWFQVALTVKSRACAWARRWCAWRHSMSTQVALCWYGVGSASALPASCAINICFVSQRP